MSTRKRTNSKSQPPALVQAYSLVSRAEEARTSGHWEEAVDMYNQASELFLLATNHTSDIETIKQLQLLSQAQSSKALEIQRQLRRFSDPNKGIFKFFDDDVEASPRTDPIPVPGRTYSQSSASPPSISDPGSTPSPSSINYGTPTGSNRSTPNSSYNSSSNILQGPVPQIPQEPQQNSQYVNSQGRPTGESFLMGSQNYFLGQAPSAANSVNEILLYQPKPGQPGYQGYNTDAATIPVQNSEVRFNANYSNNNSPVNSTVTNRGGIGIGMESYMGHLPQQQATYQSITSPRNSRGGMDNTDAVTEIPLNESAPNYYFEHEGNDNNPLMNLIPNVDFNNIWTWMEKMLDILPLKPIANMTNFGNQNSPTPQGQQAPSNGTPPASLLNSFYIVPSNNPNMYRVSSPPPSNAPKRSSVTMTDEEAQSAVKSVQLEEENRQLKDLVQKLQQENEQLRKVCDNGIQYYNDMLKQSIVQFKNEFQKRAKQASHQQMFNSVNLTPQTATYSQFLGSGKPPLMSQSQAMNYSPQINPDKEYIQQLEHRVAELSHQMKVMNEKSIKQQRLIEKYEQRFQNLTEENRIRRNMSEQSGITHSYGSHPMSNSGMSLGGSLSDVGSVYTSVIDNNSSSFANSGFRSNNMQDTQYQSVLNPNDNHEYEQDLSSSILQTKDQLSNLKLQQ